MMITASTTLEITNKQVEFIKDLVNERPTWMDTVDGPISRVIKLAIRPVPEGEKRPFMSRADGSKAISTLLSMPKTANIVKTAKVDNGVAPSVTSKAQAHIAIKDLPASVNGVKYAIKNTDPNAVNEYVFYEIVKRTSGRYINRLQGAPGDWYRIFVKYADYAGIAQRISEVGPKAAAHKYSELYTRCSCCDAPLSNGKSIEQAMGPICAKKFA